MSSSGISAAGSGQPSAASVSWKQLRQDFKSLESAVKSGDVDAAQKALATWQSDAQSAPSAPSAPSGTAPSSSGGDQFKSDLSSLFSAVQGGDIGAAQQALTTLKSDEKSLYSPASQPASSQSAVQKAFQTLVSAVQAGDTTGAQQALTSLQSALKPSGGHHHHHGGSRPAAAPASPASSSASTTSDTSFDTSFDATSGSSPETGALLAGVSSPATSGAEG